MSHSSMSLFHAVTGAIIFGKVARIQSVAQVLFSHPICVRYGTGVMQVAGKDGDDGAKGDDDDDDEDDDEAKLDLPCPILEFRLVNELSNYKGGEILDASVNVVATTLAEKDESSSSRDWASKSSAGIMEKMGKAAVKATTGVAKVSGKAAVMSGKAAMKAGATATKVTSKVVKTGGAGLMGASKRAGQATGSIVQRLNQSIVSAGRSSDFLSSPLSSHSIPEDNETVDSVTPPVISDAQLEKEIEKEVEHRLAEKIREEEQKLGIITALEAQQNNVVVDEGDSKIAPLRIFHKLEIETDSHPFFRRVWNIRHVLDAKSPLLSAKARKMIEQNNGYWPEELNDHAEVRKHLHFRELIVNFSGTANVSGSSVYAQKVYDFADVNIGYSFAQVLGLSQDGKLMVDKELINDIREQNGGGAEPFTDINVEVSAVEFAAQLADQVTEGVEAMHRGAMGAANQVAEGMKEVHNKMAEGLKGPIQNLSHSIPKTTTEEAVESSDLVDVEAGGDDPKAAA